MARSKRRPGVGRPGAGRVVAVAPFSVGGECLHLPDGVQVKPSDLAIARSWASGVREAFLAALLSNEPISLSSDVGFCLVAPVEDDNGIVFRVELVPAP